MAFEFLSGFSFGNLSLIVSLFIVFLIVLLFFGIVGGVVVFVVWNKSYNQKIILKAKVNGVPQVIGEWKGKWIKIFGKHSNERLLRIRGIDRWENPQLMSGKNVWIFWRREKDGEWINIQDEDVDEKMNTMKVKFIDHDVRAQRVANEKVLRDRLQKKKNWMEIIAQIGYIIVFIFLIMGLVILFTQLKDLSASLKETSGAIRDMAMEVRAERTGQNSLVPVTPSGAPTT